MKKMLFSGFGDEIATDFADQLRELKKLGINNIEVRSIASGKSIMDATEEEAMELKRILDEEGFGVSAVASSIGKIFITDPIEPHLEQLKHIIKIAKILGTNKLRMFSFYIKKGEDPKQYKEEVMRRLHLMLDIARPENIILCHENEAEIYGESPENCLEIMEEFKGEIKSVFDNCNFIVTGNEAYPKAYEMLKDYIEYIHIKDADADNAMVPAGEGVGKIEETLRALYNKMDRPFYVTLEPHLKAFEGLSGLSANLEDFSMKYSYNSPVESFTAAAKATFAIAERIEK